VLNAGSTRPSGRSRASSSTSPVPGAPGRAGTATGRDSGKALLMRFSPQRWHVIAFGNRLRSYRNIRNIPARSSANPAYQLNGGGRCSAATKPSTRSRRGTALNTWRMWITAAMEVTVASFVRVTLGSHHGSFGRMLYSLHSGIVSASHTVSKIAWLPVEILVGAALLSELGLSASPAEMAFSDRVAEYRRLCERADVFWTGREDTRAPRTVQMIALCPNCHTIKTHGRSREQLRRKLLAVAGRLHQELVSGS
jgi:hypothetical protein